MNEKKKKSYWFQNLLTSQRWSGFTVPVFCVILAFLAASVILLLLGKNPLVGFASFLQGSGILPKASYGGGAGMQSDFFYFLGYVAPMLLSALGFIIGFRCGLFNIGISGQMLTSGFVATIAVGYSETIPAPIAKILVIVIGAVVGGLLGAFIGFLKYRFNVHEVVSTIMVNYILNYLVGFFINKKYVNMLTRSSRPCMDNAALMIRDVNIGGIACDIPLGIFLAIAVAILIHYIFRKTVFGFELTAVGSNSRCARYTGIHVGKRMIMAMTLSGALAGLAGVTYYCGYYTTIVPKTLPGMGYDCIAVALLGTSDPIGSIFASLLISSVQNGSNYMNSVLGVQKEIAMLIIAILLLFSACGSYFKYLAHRKLQRVMDAELQAKAKADAETEQASGKEA